MRPESVTGFRHRIDAQPSAMAIARLDRQSRATRSLTGFEALGEIIVCWLIVCPSATTGMLAICVTLSNCAVISLVTGWNVSP